MPVGGMIDFDDLNAIEKPIFTRPSFLDTTNDIKVLYARRYGVLYIRLLGMCSSWGGGFLWLSTGALYSWGNYAIGEPYKYPYPSRDVPALVTVVDNTVKTSQVSMFWDTTCLLSDTGKVYATHDNTYGQYGNGYEYNDKPPTGVWGYNECDFGPGALGEGRVEGVHEFIKVSSGAAHNMGLKADGTLWGWGYSWGGSLAPDGENRQCEKGLGSIEQGGPVVSGGYVSLYPEQEFLKKTDWVDVATGWNNSYAIDSSGRLFVTGNGQNGCIGVAYYGGLGLNPPHRSIFTQIKHPFGSGESDNDWVKVKAGEVHAIFQKADGRLFGLGDNSDGQLGLGSDWNDESIDSHQGGIAWTLHGGAGQPGSWEGLQGVDCWDLGGFGYLWTKNSESWEGNEVQDFACTSYGTMVLLSDGRIMATGVNIAGEQGIDSDYDEIFRFGPVGSTWVKNIAPLPESFGYFQEPSSPHRFVRIADIGYEEFMAEKIDRSIWCWGYMPEVAERSGYVEDQPNLFITDWSELI